MNTIEKVILQHIGEDCVFVFPTQLSADTYRLHFVKELLGENCVVANERFIAWDEFKKAQEDARNLVSLLLKRVFVENMLQQNAKEPFLHELINDEYRSNASAFTASMLKIIPSLPLWQKYSKDDRTGENADLAIILEKYTKFLAENNLEDPSFVASKGGGAGNVSCKGKSGHGEIAYYIFFPEILDDYPEYKSFLENTAGLQCIHATDDGADSRNIIQFNDSRTEIDYVVSKVLQFCCDGGSYSDIIVGAGDASYLPYIERELKIHDVPCSIHMAVPLGATKWGCLFSLLLDCYNTSFGLESLSAVLKSEAFPWCEKDLIDDLLLFGQNNGCSVNVWQESFGGQDERIKAYFNEFANVVGKMCTASTFLDIEKAYFIFKNKFFLEGNSFSDEANLVLGRVIRTLDELIDIEADFPLLKIESPYAFFVNTLLETPYQEQEGRDKVIITHHKLAAAAYAKLQIITATSQSGASVVRQELPFLKQSLRERIIGGTGETNLTGLFFSLHKDNGERCIFTVGTKTFTGYAQASGEGVVIPPSASDIDAIQKTLQLSCVPRRAAVQEDANLGGLFFEYKPKIVTQSMLHDYFDCPQRYYFKRILKLGEATQSIESKRRFAMGILYHRVFELYLSATKKNVLVAGKLDTDAIKSYVEQAILESKVPFLLHEEFLARKDAITKAAIDAISVFLQTFEGCSVVATEEVLDFCVDKIMAVEDTITLEGRLDIILWDDQLSECGVIDLKTSQWEIKRATVAINDEGGRHDIDFQLPLYTFLAENAGLQAVAKNGTRGDPQSGGYFVMAGSRIGYIPIYGRQYGKKNTEPKLSRADYEPKVSEAIDFVQTFLEGIKENGQPAEFYRYFDYNKCYSCPFMAVCRTGSQYR